MTPFLSRMSRVSLLLLALLGCTASADEEASGQTDDALVSVPNGHFSIVREPAARAC